MRSQETHYLLQSAKEIRVAIGTDGERIGGQLNREYPPPVIDGEPLFDYSKHFGLLGHQLDTAVEETIVAEDQHMNQTIRVSRLKSERDETAASSYGKLVTAREGLETLYQDGGFELTFTSGETPRVPSRLVGQLQQTVKLLENPVVDLRPVKVGGFTVDLGGVAADLESERVALEDAIDILDEGRKRAVGTLLAKRRAIGRLRGTILWTGRSAEGLFHLAGEDELAQRVRSSTRRPLRPSEEEEATDEENTDPATGEETSSDPEAPAPAAETPAPPTA